jgi:hypothetical protein
LEVSPAKGITVLEAVGVDEPVGTVVVEFAVLFNATQIFGTRVAKARCQNSASVSSNSIFFNVSSFPKLNTYSAAQYQCKLTSFEDMGG